MVPQMCDTKSGLSKALTCGTQKEHRRNLRLN
jgi:hypothetical protein